MASPRVIKNKDGTFTTIKPKGKTGGPFGPPKPPRKVVGGSTGGGMKLPTKKRPKPKTGGGMKLAKKKYTSSPKATPTNKIPPSLKKSMDTAMTKFKASRKRKVPGSRGGSRTLPTTNTRNLNVRGNMPKTKIGGLGPKMIGNYMSKKRPRRR